MAALRSASFFSICFLLCSSEAQEKITAEVGQDVILPCKVPNNKITAVEWIRPEMEPDYVLLYRDGHLAPDSQHPSYQNRVDLKDKEMKDGDASLILKNVTMEDNGTYECHVFEKGRIELISIISLEVYAQTNITAELGKNVILPCKVPDNNNIHINNIIAVEWSRPGRNTEYVLVYRDGRFDPDNQHPSYQNRVDLQDKEMKDGDFSLNLKNVTKNDTGTYECWVFQKGTNRRKRSSSEPINVITLAVHPSGEKSEGAKGGIIGDEGKEIGRDQVGISRGHLGVVGVILLAVLASVGFLIYRRHMRQNPNLPVPPDEAAVEQML